MENTESLNKLTRKMIASDVKEVVSKIPFLKYSINSFIFGIKEEKSSGKKMNVVFEIKEKISFLELGIIHNETASRIVHEIKSIDRYFADILNILTASSEPTISFFSFGEGPFKGITIYQQGQYYCKM